MSSSSTPASATVPAGEEPAVPLSLGSRIANFCVIIVPFFGIVAAMILSWGWGFSWTALGLLLGMYLITGLGITVGYHRLFTHRSFETGHVLKAVFAILGSMAVQGPLLKWVALHRSHHQHSDKHGDPHSPNTYGSGILGVLRGFWHAHVGWVFNAENPHLMRYVTDLRRSKLIRVISALFPVWVLAGLILPTLLGGLITLSWSGALMGFVWGGLVRIFLVHHVTWSVNSVCHLWGSRPFQTGDRSRNNLLFGILALGEGWHNNHHAFPTSARHGLRWWQIDLSYWVIRILAAMKLAWKVQLPSPALVSTKEPR